MSKLKVSQTALDTAWRYFAKDAWLGLSETQKILSASPIQQAINSELDRIAGPLVAFVMEVADIPVLSSLNSTNIIDRLRTLAKAHLANYRKERGE